MSGRRALVLGASGLVGSHLLASGGGRGWSVEGTTHAQGTPGLSRLDVRDREALRRAVEAARPEVVFMAAAHANVDACEADPDGTARINVDAVGWAAEAARDAGARLVFFSSDYVFDGTSGPYAEGDAVAPVQEYGRQKVRAEALCRDVLPDAHLVLRITVVYGWEAQGKNFVARLIRTLAAGERMRVPRDQVGSPTHAGDLADAVWALVEGGAAGTLHLAGRDRVDRLAFARAAARAFGLRAALLDGVATAELGQAAPRPLAAGMRSGRAEARIGRRMLGVEDGLTALKREWR